MSSGGRGVFFFCVCVCVYEIAHDHDRPTWPCPLMLSYHIISFLATRIGRVIGVMIFVTVCVCIY